MNSNARKTRKTLAVLALTAVTALGVVIPSSAATSDAVVVAKTGDTWCC